MAKPEINARIMIEKAKEVNPLIKEKGRALIGMGRLSTYYKFIADLAESSGILGISHILPYEVYEEVYDAMVEIQRLLGLADTGTKQTNDASENTTE